MKGKKHQVVEGTDNAFKWARKYGVKLAWGTDLMFFPAQMTKQSTDILKLRQWFTPAEALKLVTHDNAQLLALSGPRNPYPGKLGVVAEGALADLLLVDGDPTENHEGRDHLQESHSIETKRTPPGRPRTWSKARTEVAKECALSFTSNVETSNAVEMNL